MTVWPAPHQGDDQIVASRWTRCDCRSCWCSTMRLKPAVVIAEIRSCFIGQNERVVPHDDQLAASCTSISAFESNSAYQRPLRSSLYVTGDCGYSLFSSSIAKCVLIMVSRRQESRKR